MSQQTLLGLLVSHLEVMVEEEEALPSVAGAVAGVEAGVGEEEEQKTKTKMETTVVLETYLLILRRKKRTGRAGLRRKMLFLCPILSQQ